MTATVLPFPTQQPLSYVQRLTRALDEQLPTMVDDATRLRFLRAAEHRWAMRYGRFVRNVATGRYDEPDGPSATDYALAVAEISVRRTSLEMKLRGAS